MRQMACVVVAGVLSACGPGRSGAPSTLIISVDVEAMSPRQDADHVQRLIFGRFGDHEVGIEEMMRLADKYDTKLTFFVEFCEIGTWGEDAFRTVVNAITSRGHDVQLHCHPLLLPSSFWSSEGLTIPHVEENDFARAEARAAIRFAFDTAVRLGAPSPVAYRAGGLRYSDNVLAAMQELGIAASFDYQWGLSTQVANQDDLPVFRWSNGVVEFPVSIYDNGRERGSLDLYNLVDDRAADHAWRGVSYLREKHGADNVAVMMGHSWSLLYLDAATGRFSYRDDLKRAAFERFLRERPSEVRIITASQAVRELREGRLNVAMERDVVLANRCVRTMPPAAGVTLVPSLPSPQLDGALVMFVATGRGSSQYEYQFWVSDPEGSSYVLVQDWSTADTWTMASTVAPGNLRVVVHARSADPCSTGSFDAQAGVDFLIASGSVTSGSPPVTP